jgi:hypothetical protein
MTNLSTKNIRGEILKIIQGEIECIYKLNGSNTKGNLYVVTFEHEYMDRIINFQINMIIIGPERNENLSS